MTDFLVKLDENLAASHAAYLRERGYDADLVHDQGISGIDDDGLWKHVSQEGRFLITLDLDFSDVRRFPPGTHPGILLLRPARRSVDGVISVLSRVLLEHPLDTLSGCLVVADESKTRIRRPSAADPSTASEITE